MNKEVEKMLEDEIETSLEAVFEKAGVSSDVTMDGVKKRLGDDVYRECCTNYGWRDGHKSRRRGMHYRRNAKRRGYAIKRFYVNLADGEYFVCLFKTHNTFISSA